MFVFWYQTFKKVRIMRRIILIILLLLFINISSANKCLFIKSDNIITDYKYEIIVNNDYYGSYSDNECILIYDNDSIIIYEPKIINTNYNESYSTLKSMIFYILVYSPYIISFVFILVILLFLIKRRR